MGGGVRGPPRGKPRRQQARRDAIPAGDAVVSAGAAAGPGPGAAAVPVSSRNNQLDLERAPDPGAIAEVPALHTVPGVRPASGSGSRPAHARERARAGDGSTADELV